MVEGDRRLRARRAGGPCRASSRRVCSSISTPAFAASVFRASGNPLPSRCITNEKTSPPRPQPKQCHVSRPGVTTKDGGLLAVERAQALVGRAGLLERDRLADDVDDGELVLDFGSDADGQADLPIRGTRRPWTSAWDPRRASQRPCQGLDTAQMPRSLHPYSPCQYPRGVLTCQEHQRHPGGRRCHRRLASQNWVIDPLSMLMVVGPGRGLPDPPAGSNCASLGCPAW